MKAFILAAGVSRRLYPHTYNVPKCLLEVGGKPIIHYQLEALKKFSVSDITMVVGYQRDMLMEHVTKNFPDLNFDFIINISEDGWFGKSIGPYQHFSHSIFRSIEEGKSIIRSTNNGTSALINPNGQVSKISESTYEGVIEINQIKNPKKTFFSKYGNNMFFYFIAIYISLIFFLKTNREIK